jgi:hypothetical protein
MLLARSKRDLGHDVSMIVFDDGQGAIRMVDGIRLIAAHRRHAGLPGLRFFHPRASKLFSALLTADAEVYYQSPAGAFTGITAWFCRLAGKRFIFRVASDSDCEKEHSRIRFWRDRRLFEYGLRHADLVAAQTQAQAYMLNENHRLEAALVNMLVEPARRPTPPVGERAATAWQATLRALKRRGWCPNWRGDAGCEIHPGGWSVSARGAALL